MIDHSSSNGCISFAVNVVPRASRSEIVGEHDGALRVRVAAPPVDGAANQELVRVLAKAFHTTQQAVTIVSGHNSKRKHVRIVGVDPKQLASFLNRA